MPDYADMMRSALQIALERAEDAAATDAVLEAARRMLRDAIDYAGEIGSLDELYGHVEALIGDMGYDAYRELDGYDRDDWPELMAVIERALHAELPPPWWRLLLDAEVPLSPGMRARWTGSSWEDGPVMAAPPHYAVWTGRHSCVGVVGTPAGMRPMDTTGWVPDLEHRPTAQVLSLWARDRGADTMWAVEDPPRDEAGRQRLARQAAEVA